MSNVGGGDKSGEGGTVNDPLSSPPNPTDGDLAGNLSPGVTGVGGRVGVTFARNLGPSGSLVLAAGFLNPPSTSPSPLTPPVLLVPPLPTVIGVRGSEPPPNAFWVTADDRILAVGVWLRCLTGLVRPLLGGRLPWIGVEVAVGVLLWDEVARNPGLAVDGVDLPP